MGTEVSPVGPGFLFSPPTGTEDLSEAAQTAVLMGSFASQLVRTKRTRCEHPDGRAENVAEHSLMLAKVAPELARLFYPELDEHLVARFGTIHDDLEAYVGDTPTDMLANLDQSAKDALEAKGLQQLAADFAHMPGYVQLVREYENQETSETQFVRAVDKLMVLLIHIPNRGAVLRANYTYETFLQYETALLERDGYKYGEFDKIKDLRRELGQWLADEFLR